MAKNQPGNKLSRIVSGMWMLNFAGALGLVAFFWAFTIAPQSNLGKDSPSFESTSTALSINPLIATLSDTSNNFPFKTIEAREYHDPATPVPNNGDWDENPKVI